MSLTKLRRSALPMVPPTVDEHPSSLQHARQLAEISGALAATRARIAALEAERTQLRATLAEDAVSEVLGDNPAATARIATTKPRLSELEAQVNEARERVDAQAEAVRRVESCTARVRTAVEDELRSGVEQVYRELSELLAEHFAAIAPVNARLLELQRRHGALITDAVWWNELYPRGGSPGGLLPSKMFIWLAHARERGISVPQ